MSAIVRLSAELARHAREWASADPLAWVHVAASIGAEAARNTRRAVGENIIQATARSVAGSPAVMSPKSMTAEIRPLFTSTLAG